MKPQIFPVVILEFCKFSLCVIVILKLKLARDYYKLLRENAS